MFRPRDEWERTMQTIINAASRPDRSSHHGADWPPRCASWCAASSSGCAQDYLSPDGERRRAEHEAELQTLDEIACRAPAAAYLEWAGQVHVVASGGSLEVRARGRERRR